jgi:hypothetical protein
MGGGSKPKMPKPTGAPASPDSSSIEATEARMKAMTKMTQARQAYLLTNPKDIASQTPESRKAVLLGQHGE